MDPYGDSLEREDLDADLKKEKKSKENQDAVDTYASEVIEEYVEAARKVQACAQNLQKSQQDVGVLLKELFLENAEYIGVSLENSGLVIRDKAYGNSGGNTLQDFKTKKSVIQQLQSPEFGNTWPESALNPTDRTKNKESVLWRLDTADCNKMRLPDFPEMAQKNESAGILQNNSLLLDQELGRHGDPASGLYSVDLENSTSTLEVNSDVVKEGLPALKDIYVGQVVSPDDWSAFPTGWGSLFGVILGQCLMLIDDKHKLADKVINGLTAERPKNEEGNSTDAGSQDYYNVVAQVNHSIVETVQESENVYYGDRQGKLAITEDVGPENISRNSVLDILRYGGGGFFERAGGDLSPIKLCDHLISAGNKFSDSNSIIVSSEGVDLGEHLRSRIAQLQGYLKYMKEQSECIFKADKEYREAVRKLNADLIEKQPGILEKVLLGKGDDPVVEEALNNIQMDNIEEIAGDEALFATETIFREQCWLLAYIDLLADFKRHRIDPSKKRLPYYTTASNSSLLLDGDPYAFLNRLTMNPALTEFFNADNAALANLQPTIKLFKVIYDDVGNDLEQVEIGFDSYFNQQAWGLESVLSGGDATGRGSGVGIKSFNFAYEGTNPFAVKKSISANLKIFANDIKELFQQRGCCDRYWKYADLALKTGNIKKSSATPDASFDHIEENVDLYPLNFRLRAEVGLAMPPHVIGGEKMRDALRSSFVTLNLTPTVHSFDFDDMGRVVFDVNYLAYIEEMFDQSVYNVFAGSQITTADSQTKLVALKRIERELQIKSFKKKCKDDSVADLKKSMETEIAGETASSLSFLINSMMVNEQIYYVGLTADELTSFINQGPHANYAAIRAKLTGQGDPGGGTESGTGGSGCDNTGTAAGSSPFLSTSNPLLTGDLGAKVSATLEAFKEQATAEEGDADAIATALVSGGMTDSPVISYFYVSDLIDQILRNIGVELRELPAALSSATNLDAAEITQRVSRLKQYEKNYKKFRVLLGPAELSTPAYSSATGEETSPGGGTKIHVNLGDIPISVKYFMDWITDKMLKKQEVYYPLTKFLNDLFNDLIHNFLNSTSCFGYSIRQKALLQQASLTAYSPPPRDNPQNEMVDGITQVLASADVRRGLLGHPGGRMGHFDMGAPVLDLSGPNGSARVSIPVADETNYFVFFVGRVQPTELMAGRRLSGWVKDDLGKEKFVVGDEDRGIFHYLLGRDRGIIKEIKMSKTQTPGLAEVRFEQAGYDGLTQLRVIYDVQIQTVANVNTFPGTYIYVDPHGFSPRGQVLPDTDKVDLTDLGIGGYYMIYKTSHNFGEGVAATTIQAQWVNAIENAEKERQTKILKERSAGNAQRALPACERGEVSADAGSPPSLWTSIFG